MSTDRFYNIGPGRIGIERGGQIFHAGWTTGGPPKHPWIIVDCVFAAERREPLNGRDPEQYARELFSEMIDAHLGRMRTA